MASEKIDASEYSPDTLEFIQCLNAHQVEYLIVGGEAVIFHGYPRFTEDIDFFYQRSEDNARQLYQCLLTFWNGLIPGITCAQDLMDSGYIVQFGRKPHRIDLLNQIDGVTFDECWESRVDVTLIVDSHTLIESQFIGKDALVKNKRASGRHKDLGDAEYLSAS